MKKAIPLILLASQIFVVIGFWAWNHVHNAMGNQLAGSATEQFLAYGRLAGLLAALAILLQLILVGRVKWVERSFGLDRLTRLHHVVGFSLVIFLLAHPLLVTIGHAARADVSWWKQLLDFWQNWEDVLAASIGTAMMVIAIGLSIMVLRKILNYEIWYFSHLTLYIAIALVFGHQLAVGSDFTDNRWFAGYWYALYAFVFGNLICYRLLRPLWFFLRQRFTITAVVKENSEVTSIYISGRDLGKFPIEAGQFMIVRFWARGFRREAHPFSVSKMPDGKQIRLSIKAVGDYTRRIPDLKQGTPVIIDGPHGIFTLRHCRAEKVLLIAGGIGITPLLALAEEIVQQQREGILLYSNRDHKSIVFEQELEDLAKSSSGHLQVVHILSNDAEWPSEQGRIDRDKIVRLVPDVKEREVYLCGPPGMMSSTIKILAKLEVPRNRIHYEKFSL